MGIQRETHSLLRSKLELMVYVVLWIGKYVLYQYTYCTLYSMVYTKIVRVLFISD